MIQFQRLTCTGGTTAHYWPINADIPMTSLCGIKRWPQDVHTNSFNNEVVGYGKRKKRKLLATVSRVMGLHQPRFRIRIEPPGQRLLKPTTPAHTCQRCAAKLKELEAQCAQPNLP